MKKLARFTCLLFILFEIFACENSGYQPAVTALEGAREFIDACLKGNFEKATFYMIEDDANNSHLLKIKRDYNTKSAEEKRAFGTASINIIEDAVINDSMHIINYKNSYDKIARKVKVINRNGKWQVDFKYTFNGNL